MNARANGPGSNEQPPTQPAQTDSPLGAPPTDVEGITVSVITDVAAVLFSFLLSFVGYRALIDFGISSQGYPDPQQYAQLAALFAATTLLAFWHFGLYASRLSVLHLRHLQIVTEALATSIASFLAILFFTRPQNPSRFLVAGAFLFSFPTVLLVRRVVSGWLRANRIRKARVARVLIYGAGETGALIMKKILQAPRLGGTVVGFLDDYQPMGYAVRCRNSQTKDGETSVKVLGTGDDLTRVASRTGATELCVAIPCLEESRLSAIRLQAAESGLRFGFVPGLGGQRSDLLRVEDLGAIPVLRLDSARVSRLYEFWKRLIDIAGVVLVAPVALPLGLLTAALVKLDGGPILFRQARVGLNGATFTILKYRTMRQGTDPYAFSPVDDRDPRLTQAGRLIRSSGLDELPQLLNVLRGEMSLVGPRPEMPQVVAGYDEFQRKRYAVRPGITGLWQLSPDRSAAIHENLEYDLYYLRHRSLTFDLIILAESYLFVLRALGRSTIRTVRRVSEMIGAEEPKRATPEVGRWERAVEVSGGGYVLVALDQRRRPHEPMSWSRCVPQAAALAGDCQVKLLVARRNRDRFDELAVNNGHNGAGNVLEFIAYDERDMLKDLIAAAEVVVTDLPYVVDWAEDGQAAVFEIQDGMVRGRAGESGGTSLADLARATFEGAIGSGSQHVH